MRGRNGRVPATDAGPALAVLAALFLAAPPGRLRDVLGELRRTRTDVEALLGTSLAGLRLVDSRTDTRIQVADLLAGAARKIAEDELRGHGDPELTALLHPYVTPASIWAPTGAPLP